MKKRVVPFTISAALALFLCLGFVLGTVAGRAPAYRYLTVFAQVLDLVRGNYVDQVDDQALLRGAYQGMLAGLDSYSGYFPADEYARLVKEPEGPADAGSRWSRTARHLPSSRSGPVPRRRRSG